jgi:hypothetical protein
MAAPAPEMTRPAARSTAILLAIGTLIGVIVRYRMLFYLGTDDMNAYHDWGQRALESGLPGTYHGIYFPVQYQLFELCAWIEARSSASFIPIFKLSNLVFDAGSYWLVYLLLKRQGSNPAYALLYWLHPWFLSVFSLGYIDFQFTFFVLLSVYLLEQDTAADYVRAGVPLAVAFLMKPQAQILLIATFLYGALHYVRTRDARPFGMLVFPTLLFVAYETYFTISLFPVFGYAAAGVLPWTYLDVTNVMPALTAQMTNIWYPVAYVMKRPNDPIYAISDQIQLLPYISAKYLAAGAVLGMVGSHVSRVERVDEPFIGDTFVKIFGFATIVVPFIMTSAHENHLFLGSVFLVLLAAQARPPSFKIASQVLLLVQFLNIYGLYGQHPPSIARLLHDLYSVPQTPLVYSLISVASGIVMLAASRPRRHHFARALSPAG